MFTLEALATEVPIDNDDTFITSSTRGEEHLTADLAREWAGDPELWRGLVHDVGEGRWYAPLFANDRVNGWLIIWAPGAALDLHDHGEATGTIAVVEGTLSERFFKRDDAIPLTERDLTTGSITSFGNDHIHEVRNAGTSPAVSIHVYAPSLEGMTFYELTGDTERLRVGRTETVDDASTASTRPSHADRPTVPLGSASWSRRARLAAALTRWSSDDVDDDRVAGFAAAMSASLSVFS